MLGPVDLQISVPKFQGTVSNLNSSMNKKKGTTPQLFYKASVTLVTQPEEQYKDNYGLILYMNIDVKPKKNVSNLNPAVHNKGNNTSWSTQVYPSNVRLA